MSFSKKTLWFAKFNIQTTSGWKNNGGDCKLKEIVIVYSLSECCVCCIQADRCPWCAKGLILHTLFYGKVYEKGFETFRGALQ